MKSKLLLFLALSIYGELNVNAQTTFQKTYGQEAFVGKFLVTNTNDGGYAIAGATSTAGAGGYDFNLIRTDNGGNILWNKTYGGTNTDIPYAIHETRDSGFIITGMTQSFGVTPGYVDMYLVRTDKNGDTLWTRAYGQTNTVEDGWSVQETSDSGFIVAGDWGSSTYTYLVRTNSAGDTLWTKVYDTGTARAIVQNADKGFTISGISYVYPYGNDLFMLRVDSMGNPVWYKNYGGDNTEYGYDMIKANDGGFIAVGFTASFINPVTNFAYVVKTDDAGSLVWSKVYITNGQNQGASIISTGANGYALLCRISFNAGVNWGGLLINMDNNGNVNWAKDYASNFSGNIQQTNDSGFVFTGYSPDYYLVKTDNLGNSGCNDSTATVVDSLVPSHEDTVVVPNLLYGTIVNKTQTMVSTGGTTGTVVCLSNGIENFNQSSAAQIEVFPDPALNEITVTLDKTFGQIKSLDFYNILGQRVFETEHTAGINVTQLQDGIYLIEVTNISGKILNARFQKL